MAKLNANEVGGINATMSSSRASCGACQPEFFYLVVALLASDSLKDKSLKNFGFDHEKIPGSRRMYDVKFANCAGIVRFHWKDAVVSNLHLVCPVDISEDEA